MYLGMHRADLRIWSTIRKTVLDIGQKKTVESLILIVLNAVNKVTILHK